MLQPRIPSREVSLTTLATALNNLALCSRHAPKPRSPQIIFTRHASHAAQGRANGPKDSAGRRLGAKKASQEYVIPGNIIFKQRGTKWFPGENVGLGKDHTIFSKVHGYVRYYRNPALHPKRRYIGVALEREGPGSKLPTPHNAPTRRRLGMYAAPITSTPAPNASFLEQHISSNSLGKRPEGSLQIPHPNLKKRTSLSAFDPASPTRTGGHGISNWEIGRAAEFKGVQVKEFDRKDRWTAWRIRSKKMKLRATEAASKKARKNKGKKTNKAM